MGSQSGCWCAMPAGSVGNGDALLISGETRQSDSSGEIQTQQLCISDKGWHRSAPQVNNQQVGDWGVPVTMESHSTPHHPTSVPEPESHT